MEPNAFAGAGLDRAGARRRDPAWVAARRAEPGSGAIVVLPHGVLLEPGDPPRPALVAPGALGEARELLLLGLDGGRALFALDGDGAVGDGLPGEVASLREAAARLSARDTGRIAYAAALVNWHRRHPRCSVCGSPTEIAEAGLLRTCPACGAQHHPRTDPVVIMLVEDGDRALLGRQAAWPPGLYSALAGFVEPGESLEEAVLREVEEEAGVHAAAPRYVSSQPWPFPSSLMLGFRARYLGGEPAARDGELEDVRWFGREELRAATEGRGGPNLPPRLAIARRLIEDWLSA